MSLKKGELVKFEVNERMEGIIANSSLIQTPSIALVETQDDKLVPIRFQTCVNAAGPWAARVAQLAGIGVSLDETSSESEERLALSVSLPVEPRKRYIYMFYAERGPILKVI